MGGKMDAVTQPGDNAHLYDKRGRIRSVIASNVGNRMNNAE